MKKKQIEMKKAIRDLTGLDMSTMKKYGKK